jgi:hypothetical protein
MSCVRLAGKKRGIKRFRARRHIKAGAELPIRRVPAYGIIIIITLCAMIRNKCQRVSEKIMPNQRAKAR